MTVRRPSGPDLRVLVCTTVHHPSDARILHRQIAAMLRAGWSVTYVAPWAGGEEVPAGVTGVPVPRATGRNRLSAARRARRVLRDLRADQDLFLLHDLDLLPVAFSLRNKPPVVWDVHEDTAAALSDRRWVAPFLRPLLRAVVHLMERLAERRWTLLLAEESYQQRFRRRHPVVPNLPWARPERSPRRDPPFVVYVGRISESRGLDAMLETGQLLQGEVEVRLVGPADRDVEARLRAAAADGVVEWLGRLPNDRALGEVAGAVCGLSLLRDEPNFRGSMPTKLVEYAAMGVPAISTPLPEAVTLIERHRFGLVVPFDDAAAVAARIRELARDENRWERLSTAGFEAVQDEMSWDRRSEDFLTELSHAATGGQR